MNRPGIYIVLFLGISLYYSQIPPSHQFLLYYPVLGPVRILSSHWFWSLHFLTFGPPLICFSLIIYISDPGTNFLCFIKTWCAVILIYHFYNSLFPAGCRSWWWHCWNLWWDCWRKMYALFAFPSSDTWFYFPTSSLCRFKYYLPFSETHEFMWRRMCKVLVAFL